MSPRLCLEHNVLRCSSLIRRAHQRRAKSSSARKPVERVIFSGIQPTGIPHLGNYLGALKHWVHLQNTLLPNGSSPSTSTSTTPVSVFYSIVSLHALTVPQNPEVLRKEKRDMLRSLLAVGLDPDRSTIFQQDQVPEHAELTWLLNCITPVGRLQRMTTWKAKLATLRNANSVSEIDESLLHLGLMAYPVLQAADVLLYRTTEVPVGEDQEQHIELTRDIAQLFNRTFGPTFVVPKHVFTPQSRVLSLTNPTQKMSKSHPSPTSRILLTDPPNQIISKIKSAVTDSLPGITYDPQSRPGVSNLLAIFSGLTGREPDEIAREYEGTGGGLGKLKGDLGEVVVKEFDGFRREWSRLESEGGEGGWIEQVEMSGREGARERASSVMKDVRKAVGLD